MLDKKKFYINGEWVKPSKVNDCEKNGGFK